jgi:hypothetical protein
VARERVVISTKALVTQGDGLRPAAEVVASLERSLRELRIGRIDVFHLHAVPPALYEGVRATLLPALLKERDKGKFAHLGITETGPFDPGHQMLERAVHDPVWEVVMLAFHMLNQNARAKVFPHTQANGVGTLLMFVVRSLFSRPGRLQETMRQLADEARVPAWLVRNDDPLGFLVHEGGAASVIDAAYRLCPARAGGRRDPVRHGRSGPSGKQRPLDPGAAPAGGGPGTAERAVRRARRCRARPAAATPEVLRQ